MIYALMDRIDLLTESSATGTMPNAVTSLDIYIKTKSETIYETHINYKYQAEWNDRHSEIRQGMVEGGLWNRPGLTNVWHACATWYARRYCWHASLTAVPSPPPGQPCVL